MYRWHKKKNKVIGPYDYSKYLAPRARRMQDSANLLGEFSAREDASKLNS